MHAILQASCHDHENDYKELSLADVAAVKNFQLSLAISCKILLPAYHRAKPALGTDPRSAAGDKDNDRAKPKEAGGWRQLKISGEHVCKAAALHFQNLTPQPVSPDSFLFQSYALFPSHDLGHLVTAAQTCERMTDKRNIPYRPNNFGSTNVWGGYNVQGNHFHGNVNIGGKAEQQ